MKVIKTAALVVGAVALVATGIGLAAGAAGLGSALAGGAMTIGAALGVSAGVVQAVMIGGLLISAMDIAQSLAPRPSTGGSQTKWKADPYAGIPYVMGRTLVAGNIVYRRGHGKSNKYETFVTVLSLGPINTIETSFLNKTTAYYGGTGAIMFGDYRNQAYERTQLGRCPEPAALTPPIDYPPGWTAAHRLSGLAAAINTFVYDAKSDKGLTSEPQPAWIVQGVLVYDPRRDSTYPGGNGPCRAFDETTYVYSEDPHLHALTWAMGRYQNGKRVAGIGLGSAAPGGPVRGVDVASFVEGANLNDARGWRIGGQVYTRPDTPWNSLKAMLQAGGAVPVLIGGVITAINRAPRVSLATIGPGDVAGEISFSGTQPRRSRINGIIPSYRSEAHDWEVVPAQLVQVPEYVAIDGGERTKEVTYTLVQRVNQAAQLAKYDICDAREAGPGNIPLKPAWLNYRIGDCLTFAPEPGLSIKVQITGVGLDPQTGVVTYTVRGETDGKHALALGETGAAPPIASFLYDPAIPAPEATAWALAGTEIAANGLTIPALVLTGGADNSSADAVLFEYRPVVDGLADDAGWLAGGTEPATVTRREITSVTPGTQYQVSIRYRVRGVLGARRILGPVAAGNFQLATADEALRRALALADDGKITINEKIVALMPFAQQTQNEWALLSAQAAPFGLNAGVVAARTSAAAAYATWTGLRDALNPAWNDTTKDSPVDRTAYNAAVSGLRQALDTLAQALRQAAQDNGDQARQLADAAKTLASGKARVIARSTPPTADESGEGDLWLDTGNGNLLYRRAAGSGRLAVGGNRITFGGNALALRPWVLSADDRIGQSLAGISDALSRIGVIQSDGWLSAGEKPDIIRQRRAIDAEYPELLAKAQGQGLAVASYQTAYQSLTAYLDGLSPGYGDTTKDTPIVAATFAQRFTDYYLARVQLTNASADLTAANQVTVTLEQSIEVPADYTGTIAANVLPRFVSPAVKRGGASITTAATTTYALSNFTGGCTAANMVVDNTAGSATKGQVSLLAGWSASGAADLSIFNNNVLVGTWRITATKKLAQPPTGGGTGSSAYGKSGSFSLAGKSVGAATYVEVAKIANLAKAAGETIRAYFSASYDLTLDAGASGTRFMLAKWQYAPSGTATWIDFGAGVSGTNAGNIRHTTNNTGPGKPYYEVPIFGDDDLIWEIYPGAVTCNQTATPPDGNYDVRLVACISQTTSNATLTISDGPGSVAIGA